MRGVSSIYSWTEFKVTWVINLHSIKHSTALLCLKTHTHTHSYTYTHTHTHTYIYIYIYTALFQSANRFKRNSPNRVLNARLINIYRKIYKKFTHRAKTPLISKKINDIIHYNLFHHIVTGSSDGDFELMIHVNYLVK